MSGNIENFKHGDLTADELDLVSGGSASSPDGDQTNNPSRGRNHVITNGGNNHNVASAVR